MEKHGGVAHGETTHEGGHHDDANPASKEQGGPRSMMGNVGDQIGAGLLQRKIQRRAVQRSAAPSIPGPDLGMSSRPTGQQGGAAMGSGPDLGAKPPSSPAAASDVVSNGY